MVNPHGDSGRTVPEAALSSLSGLRLEHRLDLQRLRQPRGRRVTKEATAKLTEVKRIEKLNLIWVKLSSPLV